MTVLTQIENGIAVLHLNRPEALNALNGQMLLDLNRALEQVEAAGCRGLVLTGSGSKAFCAGADISELKRRTLAEHGANVAHAQATFTRLSELDVPSVAVIHGVAFGGGLELALSCTFRIAMPTARMGLPEIKLGLIPGYGGTQRLPRLIGEARALELILSGGVMGAEEAQRVGLVSRIVESGDAAAAGIAYLAQFTPFGRLAARAARTAVRRGMEVSLRQGLSFEADQFVLCTQSEDAVEGITAFLEKRAAVFKDC